jgi:V/A-type H+-transporting ATPase subunit I
MRAGHNMLHLTLHLMREDLPSAGLALAELEAFVPDNRPLHQDALPEVPGKGFRERIRRARSYYERLTALQGELNVQAPADDGAPVLVMRREQLIDVDEWLQAAWKHCAPIETKLHELQEHLADLEQLEHSLDDFADLDIDLGRLHGGNKYLDLRIGTLPASNVERLAESLQMEGYLVVLVLGEGEIVRVAIAGIPRTDAPLGNILAAAGFQPLDIPGEFRDSPDKVRAALQSSRKTLDNLRAQMQQRLANWVESNSRELLRARQLLDGAEPYVELNEAARAHGGLAILQGWLPAKVLEQAHAKLAEHLRLPFSLETRRPRADERHLVPVPLARSRLLKPFAMLMQQYGVPRFGEFDPTVLFAVTFAAMFGMMFGDVGHGLVFILVGLLLRRRLGDFTPLFLVAGSMAVIFGFLYGSIFGVEHWLHPLWMSPMSDPMYMLTLAFIWGVGFLTLGSLIAIYNRLVVGDFIGALFDPGGVLSLVMYYALLGGVVSLVDGDGWPWGSTVLILLTLGLLMSYQWRELDSPFGERLLTVIIETFEIVNGYVSGSLSFLRVAAFSLNHVALSIAVFTLADMLDGVGHWLMIVGGNIFVIVLEGLIVSIQTLRLEYYEGFSRYFYADGTRYVPLRARRRAVPASSSRLRNEVSS